MFRRTCLTLARPKGPLGPRPGGNYEVQIPYRTEETMIKISNDKGFNSNIRERFKKIKYASNNIMAIPRDVGELPRTYVLKLLFMHQPIRLLDLWEICKQYDDVPLDSSRHLRYVLKVAALQKWVYAEKNQTDNLFYYYIHQGRAAEVRDMVRADEINAKQLEAEAEVERANEAAREKHNKAKRQTERIMILEDLLARNVEAIRAYDPEYVRSLPYVTSSGEVNCDWHWDKNAHYSNSAQVSGNSDSSSDDDSKKMEHQRDTEEM